MLSHPVHSMKIATLTSLGLLLAAVVAYLLFFPANTFVTLNRPGGGTITFSRSKISLEPAPDRYPTHGVDHLEPYVARMLRPTNRSAFLHIFTPDGRRGTSLEVTDGAVSVDLSVDWRNDPQREAAIRAFFTARRIAPSIDFVSSNGEIPDAIRNLIYPVSGDTAEITALIKRILEELCGISPAEALDMRCNAQ